MTPKERAAIQQALEALEMHAHGAGSIIHTKLAWDALREALAEQSYDKAHGISSYHLQENDQAEQEPVAWMCWIDSDEEMNPANAQLTSYEPKAYAKRKPLYAASQPVKQEPVAEIIGFERTNDIRGVKRIPRIKWNVPLWEDESPLQLGNLYAAPVSTKDLMDALKHYADTYCEGWCKETGGTFEDCGGCIARAVIAADREKNRA